MQEESIFLYIGELKIHKEVIFPALALIMAVILRTSSTFIVFTIFTMTAINAVYWPDVLHGSISYLLCWAFFLVGIYALHEKRERLLCIGLGIAAIFNLLTATAELARGTDIALHLGDTLLGAFHNHYGQTMIIISSFILIQGVTGGIVSLASHNDDRYHYLRRLFKGGVS